MVLVSAIDSRRGDAERLIGGVNTAFLEARQILPIAFEGETLLCLAANPQDEDSQAALAFASGRPVRLVSTAVHEEALPEPQAAMPETDDAARSTSLLEAIVAVIRGRRGAVAGEGFPTAGAADTFQSAIWRRRRRAALLECAVCALCIVAVLATRTASGAVLAAVPLVVTFLAPNGPVRRAMTSFNAARGALLNASCEPRLIGEDRAAADRASLSPDERALLARPHGAEQLAESALARLDDVARMLRICVVVVLSLLAMTSL